MKFKNFNDQTKEIMITSPGMSISRDNYLVSNNIITNNVKGYGFPNPVFPVTFCTSE